MSAKAAILNSMVSVDIPSGQGIANADQASVNPVETSAQDEILPSQQTPVVAESASTPLSRAASGRDPDSVD